MGVNGEGKIKSAMLCAGGVNTNAHQNNSTGTNAPVEVSGYGLSALFAQCSEGTICGFRVVQFSRDALPFSRRNIVTAPQELYNELRS